MVKILRILFLCDELKIKPVHVVFPSFLLSASSSSSWHFSLQDCLCKPYRSWYMAVSLQFLLVQCGQQLIWRATVFACLYLFILNFVTYFFVRDMVLVWDAQDLFQASQFHGLYSPLNVCCESPCLESILTDRCRISRTLELDEMLLQIYIALSLVRAVVVWAILDRISDSGRSSVKTTSRYLKFRLSRAVARALWFWYRCRYCCWSV